MVGGVRLHGRGALATAVAVVAIAVGVVGGGTAVARGTVFQLSPVATFNQPMQVVSAPGDNTHLFVVERPGTIKVIKQDGTHKSTVLDITGRVDTTEDGGLMSVAFPPNYQQTHRFYVHYSDLNHDVRIDEYRTTDATPYHASASSRRVVLRVLHPNSTNHYGGTLMFGPDGNLWISVGDGGCCYDPDDTARHLSTLLGKILRINPFPANGKPYTVPPSNPFVGKPGRDEIFSYGLRNPYRFSFDRKNGRISIGDVGQDTNEEIDYTTISGAKGANFGWPQFEGFDEIDPSRPGPTAPVDPVFDYPHSDPGDGSAHGCAVIGGFVVRAPDLPSLAGRYVYTDICNWDLRMFQPALGGVVGDTSLGIDAPNTAGFGEGPTGKIYLASLDGPVYHLRQAP
jgi:glucose/arabinose dehydrogenase